MKKVLIPANPQHPNPQKRFLQEVAVILGDDIQKDYAIDAEDFPANLPASWTDPDDHINKNIIWVSSFRLDKTAGATKPGSQKKYTVELDRGQGKLVYFDGASVKSLSTRDIGGNRVQADLSVADPPIGWS
jgi:hypothetical protein